MSGDVVGRIQIPRDESLRSELTVIQYCVPAVSIGLRTALALRTKGALLAPNAPSEAPLTMKLVSTAPGAPPEYGLTWGMVDSKGRMLNIPRTKNKEPVHVPLNDAAVAALRVVQARGDGRGRVFQSAKTRGPLENGRHWFDDAILEAGIKNFRWHDLRHIFASRLRMKGAALEDIADLLGHKSLTMTRRYAHLGPNKLHAVVSLLKRGDPRSDTRQNGVSLGSSEVVVQ